MGSSVISLGLGLGGGKSATSSGRAAGGAGGFTNTSSVQFDGTNDTMTIPQGAFDIGTSNYTFSIWARPTNISATSETAFLVEGTVSGSTERIGLFIRSNAIVFSDWFHKNITHSTTINDNTWYHLVVVKNGTGATDTHIYLNGTKVAEDALGATQNLGTDKRTANVGDTGISGGSFPFEGQLDEFAFWRSALSASDIGAIYNSGVPGDISSLNPVGLWRMGDNDGASGTTITDQGSGGNNGTLVNGPTFSATVPS